MRIAVITDSTASLTPELAATHGIAVVPIQVVIGADTFTEGVDVSASTIARALRDGLAVSTSRPAPQAFVDAYRVAAAAGADHVVSVHLSAKISGTYESAVLAARESPVPVTVIDTGHVGSATGAVACTASRAVAAGAGPAEVDDVARRAADGAATYFYVDTLEFLRRGGRIGAAAALIGSALAVKPLLGVVDGEIVALEKVRTEARALARLHDLVVAHVAGRSGPFDLCVQHLANAGVGRAVAEKVAQTLGCAPVPVREVGASIGAHVGPGLVAVSAVPRLEV